MGFWMDYYMHVLRIGGARSHTKSLQIIRRGPTKRFNPVLEKLGRHIGPGNKPDVPQGEQANSEAVSAWRIQPNPDG